MSLRRLAGLAFAAALSVSGQEPLEIKEASGVARSGSSLLVVDDSDVGAYFRVDLPSKLTHSLLDLNAMRPERVLLKSRGLGVDLESIGILADSRVALLSERLRSLVSDDGIIAEYDSELAEVGKRGLEGLAIRPLPDGNSRVAVIWEGGYPDFGIGPRRSLGDHAWQPLIVVHDVPKLGRVGRVRLREALTTVELKVPRPSGDEPSAQRYRAPDLCWYRWRENGKDQWGFIVLLSSLSGVRNPTFERKLIQRFNMDGNPVGDPIDLAEHLPTELRAANWEGLNWFEAGKSVVLVHESESGKLQPHAMVLELPKTWQFDAAGAQ